MGWIESGIKTPEAEDVAQHSFETASIALILSHTVGRKINRNRAIEMAIIHDWAESVTGDFSKNLKDIIGHETKEKMEKEALEESLLENLPNREVYLELWEEYIEKKTNEAKLVSVSDRLSVLFEASYLFQQGERAGKLKEIWKTVRSEVNSYTQDFPVLKDLLKELDENYPFDDLK